MLTSKDHVIGIGLIIILISCFVWTLFLKNKNKEEFDKNTSFYRYICEERGDLFGPFAGGYINKEGTRYDSLLVCYDSRSSINDKTFLSIQVCKGGTIIKNGEVKKLGLCAGRIAELNSNVATFEETYYSVSDLRKDCIGTVKMTFFQDKAVVEEMPKCASDYSFAGVYLKENK